jgi:hypothetical protein
MAISLFIQFETNISSVSGSPNAIDFASISLTPSGKFTRLDLDPDNLYPLSFGGGDSVNLPFVPNLEWWRRLWEILANGEQILIVLSVDKTNGGKGFAHIPKIMGLDYGFVKYISPESP